MTDTNEQMDKSGHNPNRPHSPIRTLIVTLAAYVLAFVSIVVAVLQLVLPLHPTFTLASISWNTVSVVVGVAALVITITSSLVIVARYLFTAARKIRLGKDDYYFVIALVVGVASIVISHFWR